MNEQLILADGTGLVGHALESGDKLFLYVYETYLQTLFNLLIDPDKCKKITMIRNGQETVFKGYKHMYCISEEMSGMISAGLKKA